MRNITKNLILIVAAIFISMAAQAQEEKKSYWDVFFTAKKTSEEFQPKSDSFIDKLKHRLLVAKDKAVNYYNQYLGEDRKIAEEKKKERQIASETQAKVEALANELPSYTTQGLEEQTREIEKVREQVTKAQVTSRVEGRKADQALKKAKSGVVVFDVYEKPTPSKKGEKQTKKPQKLIKTIPHLDIGIEDQIVAQDFQFELPRMFSLVFEKINELKSPDKIKESELAPYYTMQFEKAKPAEKFDNIVLALPKDITPEKVKLVPLVIAQDTTVTVQPFVEMTVDEVKFLKGVILAEYKDKCHLSVGLLKAANNIKDNEKLLKDYFYSACMHKMGFYTDSVPALTRIAQANSKLYSKNAVSLLLDDLKREYISDVGAALEKISIDQIDDKDKDAYYYYRAMARSMRKDNGGALSDALKVTSKSSKYVEAQYLASVAEYFLGKVEASLERQEKLLVEIDKRGARGSVKALIKMNMGRAAYRSKQYKKAIEAYQFIGKDNPLWIQALTEQGWMQVLAGDAPGAIGNMHSIQIPQFKDIYKPESYAVRAIGYINICQYGDAQKTLNHLTKIYTPWISAFKTELKKTQYNYAFYNNIVAALRGGENKTALPQPVVRELTRHKDFLNVQESINNKVDEEAQFPFIAGLIRKDESTAKNRRAAALGRSKDLQNKINTTGKKAEGVKFVNQWKTERSFEIATSEYYDFEIETAKESFDGFKSIERVAKKNVADKKENFKSLAGKIMKTRLASMQKRLEKLVENNEFLAYEILSGSGENIRYVSAGGQVKGTASTREIASKSSKGKMYLWDFDGEFWADEIGNYKSSLKDNCAKAGNLMKKIN